jgi:hypothetical protein
LHNWEKPPLGFLKCNVDAAISNNVAGIKIVDVNRNASSIAHFLANLSFDFMGDVSWSHAPDFLCTVLSSDA